MRSTWWCAAVALDPSIYVRQTVIATLRRAAEGGGVLRPGQIFAMKAPSWAPYEKLQYGQPIASPFVASCLDGARVSFAIHSYAETEGEGAETVGGERRAHDLAAWAVGVLGDTEIDLQADSDCPRPATVYFDWTGTQVISDGQGTDAFHGIATFAATVSS